ncbi:MAG: T9SS type A sorting domain-containing protein [Bacteroidota bacterium]|nr:T9SS type A sorting domain-containing protein [Bacteroidota bacterium]
MNKRIFTTFLILFFFNNVKSQEIIPLGNGIPEHEYVFASCTDSPFIYYACYVYNYDSNCSQITVRKWNGMYWDSLPKIMYSYYDSCVLSMCVYNGNLYLGGFFDSIHQIKNSALLIRFNGVNWENVGNGFTTQLPYYWESIEKLIVYKGELYAGGYFHKVNNMSVSNIAKWNDTIWSKVGLSGNEGVDSIIWDMLVHKNKLIIAGDFDHAGGQNIKNITGWNKYTWSSYQNSFKYIFDICEHDNKIFALAADNPAKIFSWSGNQWDTITTSGLSPITFQKEHDRSLLSSFDGKLWYAHGIFKWNNNKLAYFENNVWKYFNLTFSGSHHFINNIFTYKNNIYVNGFFFNVNTKNVNKVFCLSKNYGTIKGTIYHDSIENCIINSSEYGLDKKKIVLYPSEYSILSDKTGNYKFDVIPGNYVVQLPNGSIDKYKYWRYSSCQKDTYNLQISSSPTAIIRNFALKPIPGIKDLAVKLSGTFGAFYRDMDTTNYYLNYVNYGTVAQNATVTFQYYDSTYIISCNPNYSNQNNRILSWDFNLAPREEGIIKIQLVTRKYNSRTETVLNTAITPISGDSNIKDNHDTLVLSYICSFDPNNKVSDYCKFIPLNKYEIRYHINFQNTGTDTAFKVVITDTLDHEYLVPSSLLMVSASNDYKVKQIGNVVIWTFDNIMLPDSNVDELNSHGFVEFSIKRKENLVQGDSFSNCAAIYFDYNAPVITEDLWLKVVDNKASLKEIDEKSVEINLFPVPANNYVYIDIKSKYKEEFVVEFYDLLGNIIYDSKVFINNKQRLKLDVSNVSAGMYLITVRSNKYQVTRKVLISDF